jgi:hypothetical protein
MSHYAILVSYVISLQGLCKCMCTQCVHFIHIYRLIVDKGIFSFATRDCTLEPPYNNVTRAGIFKQSMGARNREEEQGYRTGLPGYIGWRHSFLGIDSRAP